MPKAIAAIVAYFILMVVWYLFYRFTNLIEHLLDKLDRPDDRDYAD